ncbi:MAG TPA: helix-turn-helix domain-containing protein [Opitutaceae bacterium]|nr:helix-turn-helix domain-containing protein [Opitutaceae bacterium]
MLNTVAAFPPPLADNIVQHVRETVTHLQKSEIYRDYEQAFQTTTGLPLAVRAAGSFQPPLHGARQSNPFCGLMAGANKTCAACLQLQQRIEEAADNEPKSLECFAGLTESAIPIRLGDNVLAYLQTGQVMLRQPSKEKFKNTVRQLSKWGAIIDLKQLEAAYYQTRVIARKQYDSALRLLSIFAQHLSTIGNQIVLKGAAAEAPAIVKARAYIAEHHSEELSLAQVARAVNMSVFYFCKMFKKETGLTFVDYLARLRVETVKELLLNPHKRVSEAAYEAGFQSLSQFNRVFRRIAGEAPSAYRERLHGSADVLSGGSRSLAHAA